MLGVRLVLLSDYPKIGESMRSELKILKIIFITKSLLCDKLIGALPLTKCRFSHYLFWLRRIL
jgi:hypothetical protein